MKSLNKTKTGDSAETDTHLISHGVLTKILVIFGVLALLTVIISIGGRWLGQTMAMGGRTDKTDIIDIFIGRDHLRVPANLIRIAAQRHTGTTDQLNLQLTWPEMEGYTAANSFRFLDQKQASQLISIELSQRIMTLDMSGRLDPIYKTLFDGNTRPGAAGLTIRQFKADGPYKDEVMLTMDRAGKPSFAIRCLMLKPDTPPTSADCQRDVYLGQDLSVLVRYSSVMLPQWEEIEAATEKFVRSHLSD